jgi:hypothetical protein
VLELIEQWGQAAEKGGPWFLVALLGAIIYLGGRWLYARGQKIEDALRAEIKDLQKAAIEREKKCAEDCNRALADQAKVHEARYDALRDQSRNEHTRRNDEIKEVAVTMTTALNQEAAAKHLQSKALDEMQQELDNLVEKVIDLHRKLDK